MPDFDKLYKQITMPVALLWFFGSLFPVVMSAYFYICGDDDIIGFLIGQFFLIFFLPSAYVLKKKLSDWKKETAGKTSKEIFSIIWDRYWRPEAYKKRKKNPGTGNTVKHYVGIFLWIGLSIWEIQFLFASSSQSILPDVLFAVGTYLFFLQLIRQQFL
ncbi:MAG: hypothetical protein SOU94_09850 [Acidaminococcus sp.]|uniref:Uncharacterized protein n=1 Tax=Acidaminococcus intestini TaxID=187327 RepID=A0A943EI12_9FIRM|nr:hypothetical protein [Acidaminococcus sp.]MBS5520213.1 hypothetical protein [Acidaminococcus intestini]MDY2740107.1 hypothetical protein [Acidaminococcus sp.]